LSGKQEIILQRLQAREAQGAHFMPSTLLKSQFQTLEVPHPDERAIVVSIDQSIYNIVESIVHLLIMRAT
jgi:gluconokinase